MPPEQSPIAESAYDALAESYEDITQEAIREEFEWPTVESLLPELDGARVVDGACGDGYYTQRIAADAASVVGIDTSSAMVERARHRFADTPDVTVFEADLTGGLPFIDDGTVDVVLCQLALEHVRDWTTVFETFGRILVAGGVVVVSTSNPVWDYVSAAHEDREQILADSATYNDIEQIDRDWGDEQVFRVPFFRRSLEAVFTPVTEAGLVVDAVREPVVTEAFRSSDPDRASEFESGPPNFLCLRCRLPEVV